MAYNLNPEHGRIAAEAMEKFFASYSQAAQDLYNACMAGGEGNNVAQQYKEKFKKFEAAYNAAIGPMNTCKASLEAYTDFAEHRAKVQINGDVKNIDAEAVDAQKFSAAKDL